MASEDLFGPELSEEIVNRQGESPETEENVQVEAFEEDDFEQPEEIDTATDRNNAECAAATESRGNTETRNQEARLVQLPIARIRNLMKLDPDLNIASNEAVFLVTRSTEYFIESLAREAYSHTAQAKKKTVQKRDVDLAISSVDSLMFLDGAMQT